MFHEQGVYRTCCHVIAVQHRWGIKYENLLVIIYFKYNTGEQ